MKGKGFISESDVALLLQRYTASTLLALLQEVANSGCYKLNWTSLVKSSITGIKNAREYQALWRHLAYRTSIADGFEDDSQPLEDDSDLEYEVEPFPGVSPEVAADVAACVKVLAATETSGNLPSKNSETCFAIDIPNSSGWEVKGNGQTSNVVIQGGATSEMQPARKKRKLWTLEEDQELIAAVEKCGEGNWATILKGAFKHDRTAAQLSQRWALIRKRREIQTGISQTNTAESQVHATGNSTGGGIQQLVATGISATADGQHTAVAAIGITGSASAISNSCSTAVMSTSSLLVLSQEQSCTRNMATAATQALPPLAGKSRPPMKRAGVSGSQHGRLVGPSAAMMGALAAQATSVVGSEIRQGKSLPAGSVSVPIASSGSGRYNASSGMRSTSVSPVGRGSLKSSTGPDPMVQAAAVAAGARIAPASAAASLLKAAQLGNVVHIGRGGVSMGKAGISSQAGSSTVTTTMKVGSGTAGSRTPSGTYVHYIRTGTSSPSPSFLLNNQRASQVKSHTSRTNAAQVIHPPRSAAATLLSPLNSGLSVASSPLQKPHPPASMLLPAIKSRPKLPLATVGENCGNATMEGSGKPARPREDCGESLSDGLAKPSAQDSASVLTENVLTPVPRASANLTPENAPGCKTNRQAVVPVSEPSACISDIEGSRDDTQNFSQISSSSPTKDSGEMGVVTDVATLPVCHNCSIEAANIDNLVSPAAASSRGSQGDTVEESEFCKLVSVNHSGKEFEASTLNEKVAGTTNTSSEVNIILQVKSGMKNS